MGATTLASLQDALEEMPLFPLREAVLFPHAHLPLHVFEPRYRTLVRDCLASHRVFAIVWVKSAEDEAPLPELGDVAGAGVVVEHQALEDGRSMLVVRGEARVRLRELPFVAPYRRARATVLHDLSRVVPEADCTALLASASAFSAEIRRHDSRFTFSLPAHTSPGALADLCAHHLLIDPTLRQTLLSELDPRERVRMVTTELAVQHAALLRNTGGLLH
jgi:Lon protease-like protein